jgi:hypothetical protein
MNPVQNDRRPPNAAKRSTVARLTSSLLDVSRAARQTDGGDKPSRRLPPLNLDDPAIGQIDR